jgi:hypothetical protein
MRLFFSTTGPAMLAFLICTPAVKAATPFSDQNLKPVMQRIEARADTFENKLEHALDHSVANGSDLEDQMNRIAAVLEDSVDDMAENFSENHSTKFIDNLENALIAGAAIDRVMLRRDLAGAAEADWRSLRADLNTVAMAFHRPVLPNVTVTTITTTVAPALLSKPNVTHVMERIEAGTDRFEDKLKDALQHSTANMTDREELFSLWANGLESASDEMLEQFKEKDTRDFVNELQNTLMMASAINRIMLRSDLSADAHTEWTAIRNDLNTLATTFARPVLPDTVAHVRTVAVK